MRLAKLRVSDVDRTGDVWVVRLKDHKTAHHDQERTIFVGPRAQQVLSPFLARPAAAYCFSPAEATNWLREQRAARRITPLSCGNRAGTNRKRKPRRRAGDRYSPASYYYVIRRACMRAGVELWSPARLRHTAGTDIRHRFGLEASQVYLGHAQVTTTQIYAERDMAKGLEVARCVG